MLATIGAFRVVSESDLHDGRRGTPRKEPPPPGRGGSACARPLSSDDRAVVLTDRGRDLLEANRLRATRALVGTAPGVLRRPQKAARADARLRRSIAPTQRAEERLRGQGGRVDRVVLDYELKRDYQRFLHERNRGKKDCDGRPDREPEEIARWAREHDLPYDDGHVHFPDARVEHEDRDGRRGTRTSRS